MIDFNRHIEIDNYLKGALAPQEMAAFESKIESDVHLQKELELQRNTNLLVKNSAQFNLKSQLKNIHKEQQKKKAKKKALTKKGLYAVAAVIIASAVVAMALYIDESVSSNNDSSINEEVTQTTESQIEKTEIDTPYIDDNDETFVDDTKVNDVLPVLVDDKDKKATKRQTTTEPLEEPLAVSEVVEDEGQITDNDLLNEVEEVPASDSNETEVDDENYSTDACTFVNQTQPMFDLIEPCFGGAQGKIKMESSNDIYFTHYSINNGDEFVSVLDELKVDVGRHQVVAKDENNCLSAVARVEVKYGSCNYVIQPQLFRHMELDLPQVSSTFTFEVRNARSRALVYTQLVEQTNAFVYKGINQSRETLSLGNYVYMFIDEDNKLIAKGQVTIVQ
jgi:Tfp pilus assembly protein PilV